MEYYNEHINTKVVLSEADNSIKVVYLDDGTREKQIISSEDFNEIDATMRVPGFGWGMVLIKIGRAFGRAVGAGSDAN